MESHYDRVKTFMKLAGQETPPKPMIPDDNTQKLRLNLLLEELLELVDGMGFNLSINGVGVDKDATIELKRDKPTDLVKVADGLADISVVNVGAAIAFGFPFPEIVTEVDRNNLAKFGPGGYRREDGKWIKPPDHKPPKIQEIVEKHLENKGTE